MTHPDHYARMEPATRFILSMAPYQPIEKNPDGSGGGIRLRVYGSKGGWRTVDVVWGERTEIEVWMPGVSE